MRLTLGATNIALVTTDECIKFFGSKAKLAAALHIAVPSVYGWREYPPPIRQLQLASLTRGALKAEPDLLKLEKAAA